MTYYNYNLEVIKIDMKNSILFSINSSDLAKGVVSAVITGIVLPLIVMFQDPNFSIFTVNWSIVLDVAIKGAVSGFISYIGKNFLSDDSGKFLGRIG